MNELIPRERPQVVLRRLRMNKCKSAKIRCHGYSKNDNILWVQFHDNSIYQYDEVPYDIYVEFRIAHQPHRYLMQHINKSRIGNRIKGFVNPSMDLIILA